MAAVRAILSTLSGLAYAGPALAGAWRPAPVAEDVPDPWDGEYAHAGPEPLLDDLLDDPLVRSVMQADRIEPAELRRELVRPRQRISV